MIRIFITFITTTFLVPALALAAMTSEPGSSKTIYGNDDRFDLYQVTNSAWKTLADSTVALVNASDVLLDPNQKLAKLKGARFGDQRQLCSDERFFEQQVSAFCSGFLVAPDVIATAGHCVDDQSRCSNIRFIFGFTINHEGDNPANIPVQEIYECSKLLGREQNDAGADWALVRLNRPVTGHAPLAINRQSNIIQDAPLMVIGHPSGLATKVAGGANVRDASPAEYFVANLDTFGGNSGSAVFNANTGLVEGILVRGANDFAYDSSRECYVSNVCAPNDCRGEDSTKMSAVKGLFKTAN